MGNTRQKGFRSLRKAKEHVQRLWPSAVFLPIYQVSQWAQRQPFDAIVLIPHRPPLFVEVRSNQWGVSKPQTVQLTELPGVGYSREVWRFRNGSLLPDRRVWSMGQWRSVTEQEESNA